MTRLAIVTLGILSSLICCIQSFCQSPTIHTGYGSWVKQYFLDDFNDPLYEHPYIQTFLYNGDHTLFIRFAPERGGVMDMNIQEDITHNKTKFISPVTLSVKKADGTIEKFNIPQATINGGDVYLPGSELIRFANAINNGNCKISLHGQTSLGYSNTPSTFVFSSTNQTKNLLQAIKKEFDLSPASTTEEEFMTHSMGNFAGTYTLRGTVGGVPCLTMKLTFKDGSVSGTCKYDGNSSWNKVKGNLANLGAMVLTEYYSTGYEVWEYSGEFNGKAFRGDVIDPDRGTSEPIYLIVQ